MVLQGCRDIPDDVDHGATLHQSIVGHEIVGALIRVGGKVKNLQVGDLVDVGPNARSRKRGF